MNSVVYRQCTVRALDTQLAIGKVRTPNLGHLSTFCCPTSEAEALD